MLGDPAIAGFEVTTLINEPHHRVGQAIGEFYRTRRRDDLTLLYFTGHGLKDDDGKLYLAMTNTLRDNLLFTGLPAEQVDQAMESCVSRQKVLVLDCCYSGAFPAGRVAKADTAVHALERFQGRGRTVLTASDATQYSFEGDQPHGRAVQSVFTHHLVAGLRDGSADLDGDGDITLDELYSYVHDRVVAEMPQQRPKKQDNVEGRTVIARNINWTLPAYLRNAVVSPIATDRLAALEALAHLYRIGNDLVRGHARDQIRNLTDDDSKLVSAAATTLQRSLTREPRAPSPELVDSEQVDTKRPAAFESADSPQAEDVGHGNLPPSTPAAETDPPTTAGPAALKTVPPKSEPPATMAQDSDPAPAEPTPESEHRSRSRYFSIVGGILTLAAALLILAGQTVGMGSLGDRYLNLFALVTVMAGSCLLAPRTRMLVGPGMLLGLAVAAIWGGVGFGLELPEYPWHHDVLLFTPAGHAILYVAALVVVVPMFVNGSVRVRLRRTPDALTWRHIGLLTAASCGVSAGLVLVHGSNQLFKASYLVAAVLAIVVPLVVAVLVPRRFGLSVLAGWLVGLWVVWLAADAGVDYQDAVNVYIGLPIIALSGGAILLLTLVSAAVTVSGAPSDRPSPTRVPPRRPRLRIAAYVAAAIVAVLLAGPGIASYFTDRNQPSLLVLDSQVVSVAFSPDGKTLATGSNNDKRVRLWNLATGETVGDFETEANPAYAFSLNGKTVAVVASSRRDCGFGTWRQARLPPP